LVSLFRRPALVRDRPACPCLFSAQADPHCPA
jgi:hypothetical protein